MLKRIFHYALILLCSGATIPIVAQNDPKCSVTLSPITQGDVFFNYGSVSDAYSIKNRTGYSLGQSVVGFGVSQTHNSQMGYWSRFFIPPLAPIVTATQGELLDRIQVSWDINPLGAQPVNGFKLYRDGVFLALVDYNTRNFNDFNVIAGKPYNYEVRGINLYGEGMSGKAIGFQVPNGVVTGWVQTLNGSPVPDAVVTLTPMQGFSLKFGAADGAFIEEDTSSNPFMPLAGEDWTMSFWIKTDVATANAGIMQLSPFPLYIRALNSTDGHEGVEIATTETGTPFLTATFVDSTKNGWHHVALTFEGEGNVGRLYIDGVLSTLSPMSVIAAADLFNLGSFSGTSGWAGYLDELRIYHRLLDELDLREVMTGTASSLTPGLTHYWKMDEQQGTKSYDILNRQKLYFCGARFNGDRPPVHTAGKTNEEGYYRIESASYGTGTTFLAKPAKDFYMHRALKMKRSEGDYAALPDFSVTAKATLELWVNSGGPDGQQCLISKRWPGNDFRVLLKQSGLDNQVWFYLNGTEQNFGNLGMGYQHLAFTIDSSGSNRIVTAYKNGQPFGTAHTFPGVSGDFSDPAQNWILGARPSGSDYTDYYGGLMDEVALYDTILSNAVILNHFQHSRDIQEKGLRVYFALDEGNGIRLNNSGSVFLTSGTNHGASWSPFAANQSTEPHVFTPVTRQVTLNPSVTSVDQVDFIDRSTIPVSGFVRYKNTDCFAKNVEILVNGASFSPKIFTDSTGRFVIDFDPGATATLTPVFKDHVFVPAFWDVTNVSSPIAGILFNDVTTRKIKGRVAGGLCKKSIIKAPPGMGQGTVCVVKVASVNGCLVRQLIIDNQDGDYEFDNMPPLESITVSVVEHSDPDVKSAFQVQGGSTINLSERDTVIDFTYFAPPQVTINSGMDLYPGCNTYVLDKGEFVTLNITVNEQYVQILDNNGMVLDDGLCPLDSAYFNIVNGFSDEVLDTTMSGAVLQYTFRVGDPNPSPPYLKTLQIVATSLAERESSISRQAIVTGIINKDATFVTTLPETPVLILRDPPGDGSSSFLEKNTKVCHTHTFTYEAEGAFGGGVELHLGGNVEIIMAPLGIGNIINSGPIFDTEEVAHYTTTVQNDSVLQTCLSFDSRIETSTDDMYIGQEADLYMGEAVNIKFGFADEVSFDTCVASTKVLLNVEPGDQPTTFIYSHAYIDYYQIPYLTQLRDDPATDSLSRVNYDNSITRWTNILARNTGLKERAKFKRNISFDALTTFEYAETSEIDTSYTPNNGSGFNASSLSHIGFQFNEFGVQAIVSLSGSSSVTTGNGLEHSTGITTGYTLSDDDVFDAFSVNVLMDSVYNTPVFSLYAGQSSCPWEAGTANRERPNLALAAGSEYVAINVPAEEPAVFKMNLGNLSATNEDWTYGFTAIAASNPHGAVIKLNGQVLNNNTIQFIVPYGTSVPITLTIDRGPLEYDYDSLLVALVSECEMQRNFALSLPLDGDPKFFSPLYLGAHFVRPCSEVNINAPEQNWVVLRDDPVQPGTLRRITVSGYDLNSTDFQLVRVQYRRTDGDGAWINIPNDISERYNPNWSGYAALPDPKPPTLGADFTQFFWETAGLADGLYEIHAWAVCTGDASDKPGFSDIIKGRIDREPPSLVGVPQPSDGVYNVGDEVSFTFNKHINCNKLIKADLTQPNNVGLYDAITNKLIDIDVTCYQNRVILDPNFQNEFFENHILRAELRNIQDLTGNESTYLKWEFYVDRNELAWLTDSVGMTKYEDQTKTITANIHNRGGYPVPFTIKDIPAWVHVVPTQGTLAPNEIRPLSFTIDSTLAFGMWSDSITLHTETGQNPFFMGGDEGLPLGVRVVCRPPVWNFNGNIYENTMNMVLELNIQGSSSIDVEDIVVAYIGDTLCGRANVQYVPQVGKYLAYLTIYGNPNHVLQSLRLEIWDASACLRYSVIEDDFKFQPDQVVGNAFIPQVIHTSGYILRDVPMGFGWNWISFNLDFPDNDINEALSSLKHPQSDLMKGQDAFSIFVNGGGWIGTLDTLGNKSMYIYRADQPDTLKMLGNLIDPATTSIPLVSGWNWIGYIPNYSLPVNDALSSLSAQTGDIIKSQTSFAQYINPQYGWIGNLKYMQAPKGYQIKLTNAGTLVYPQPVNNLNGNGTADAQNTGLAFRGPETGRPESTFWSVDPTKFEYSMTLIGMLKANGENATTETMELGVFAGNEARGSVQAIYVAPLQSYMFFLTVYANSNGEQLRYKLYDSSNGSIQDLTEIMYFSPDLHQGSVASPVPFTLGITGTQDISNVLSFDVQPNPFHTETLLRFSLEQSQEVLLTITNISGKQVLNTHIEATRGLNTMVWKGKSDAGTPLAAGIYFVRLQTESGSVVRKVVLN